MGQGRQGVGALLTPLQCCCWHSMHIASPSAADRNANAVKYNAKIIWKLVDMFASTVVATACSLLGCAAVLSVLVEAASSPAALRNTF